MSDRQEPSRDVLNLAEAAQLARIGLEAFKELVERGEIPCASLNQKHSAILREDVLAYLRDVGRKQAADRRSAVAAVAAAPAHRRREPRARAALPDLDRYEAASRR